MAKAVPEKPELTAPALLTGNLQEVGLDSAYNNSTFGNQTALQSQNASQALRKNGTT